MKNIIVFGASGFLGSSFITKKSEKYNFIEYSGRKDLDFTKPEHVESFRIPHMQIDGVLFMQGISPSVGFEDIEPQHFNKMFNIDVVSPFLILRKLRRNKKLRSNCCIVFISSIAAKKGSYDPAYACAKSSIQALTTILKNNILKVRINTVLLGLVEDSPVHKGMTVDFIDKHKKRMNGKLVKIDDVVNIIDNIIENESIDNTEFKVDCGYKLC